MGRKILFWGHLMAGLMAGVFILMMSVTGALLTYETQITDWARTQDIAVPADGVVLSPEALIAASGAQPGQVLTLAAEAGGLVTLTEGRRASVLDPYSGAVIEGAGASVSGFFQGVEGLHRWLSLDGRSETGGWVVDAANLMFLVLVVSGLFLWLPKTWRWALVKTRLLFRRKLPNAQARDHNWHHVFGIWALGPLFVIVLTGVIMSYGWANALVFASVGEDVPLRGGPPVSAPASGAAGGGQALQRGASNVSQALERGSLGAAPLAYTALIAQAEGLRPDWVRVSITVPEASAGVVALTLDAGNGQRPAAKTRFVMDRATGEVLSAETGATGTTGMKLRMWARFAHTGQYYGDVGQTIAGLASLAGAVLVYTGMAMGLRRLTRMWRRLAAA